jgi:hypothetical protein
MKITKGESSIEKTFRSLEQQGCLVDIYSKGFFSRQPSREDDPTAPYSQQGFQEVIDHEQDPDIDCKPVGHLIFVYVDPHLEKQRLDLCRAYPPLRKFIGQDSNVDFLILNLFTQQILHVCLDDNSRLHVKDVGTDKKINAFELVDSEDDRSYMDRFTEHDIYESVRDFIEAVYDLGYVTNALTMIPQNYDILKDNKVKSVIEFKDDQFTFKTYSLKEMLVLHEKYAKLKELEDQAIKMINVFFPQFDLADLER